MRVFIINSVCGYGSTGKLVSSLQEEIINSGGECCVAYGRGKVKSKFDNYKIGNKFDVIYHAYRSRINDKQGLYSINATKKLIKKIREYKPDIIHLHNIHGYFLNYELLFSFIDASSIPIVWTLHDCWSFTGHCAYYDFVGCSQWQVQCEDCKQKKAYPATYFISNSKSNFKKKKEAFCKCTNMNLVVPSYWLAGEVKKSFLKNYVTTVIYNGIDLEQIAKRNTTEAQQVVREKYELKNTFTILGVANIWESRKGLSVLEEIAELKHDRWQVVVVGDVRKRPHNKYIKYIERTDAFEELVALYGLADVFVNPTYEDNFPTTNIEALAAGTPVITFDTGGSGEAIDEHTGYVVAKGNIDELIKKIELLEEKKIPSEECIKRAKKFTKKKYFEGYHNLYKKLLENK